MLISIILTSLHSFNVSFLMLFYGISTTIFTGQKMKFSIDDFISNAVADLVTFTKEILNGKLHFLCSDLSFHLDSLYHHPDSPHFLQFHPDFPHSHANSLQPHYHSITRIPTLILPISPIPLPNSQF